MKRLFALFTYPGFSCQSLVLCIAFCFSCTSSTLSVLSQVLSSLWSFVPCPPSHCLYPLLHPMFFWSGLEMIRCCPFPFSLSLYLSGLLSTLLRLLIFDLPWLSFCVAAFVIYGSATFFFNKDFFYF